VERACIQKGVARLSFDELCRQPRGAIDYLEVCRNFHTLFVEGVPRLSILSEANVVRRFISLIDVCYEAKSKLVCTAAAPPSELVTDQGTAATVGDESFAFDRTVSRLREMQSQLYLQSHVEHKH
jgi:predicted ATPase